MATGDVRGFKEVAREELRHPARLLGMGFFWAWLQIVFSSGALAPQTPLPLPIAPQHQLWTASLLVTSIVFLAVLAFRPFGPLRSPRAIAVSSALMAGGSLCLALGSALPDAPFVVAAGVASTGAGSALAFLEWGDHLAKLEPRRVLFDMALYAGLTAAFFGIVAPLPSLAVQAAAVAMPLLSGALLRIANRTVPASVASVENRAGARRRSVDLLSLAVVVGLVYGVMRGVTLAFGRGTVEEATLATVLGVAASGILLLATTVFYRKESELYLVCEISFPLLAAGFLLLPQFTDGLSLPLVVFTVGHGYFYFLLWVFCVDQSQTAGRDPLAVFAAGLLAFLGSSLVGSVASDVLALTGFEESGFVGILSLVVVYLFVLVFAVLFGRTRAERSRDLQEADERRRLLFDRCALQVAEEGGLTSRETEIFAMLAHGRDRASIREQLCISNDTVKTHTRRIYAKLNIHAKQEARELVETRMEREERGM